VPQLIFFFRKKWEPIIWGYWRLALIPFSLGILVNLVFLFVLVFWDFPSRSLLSDNKGNPEKFQLDFFFYAFLESFESRYSI
jgi:hypothetical protein